jgi:outer membrane lipoprotein-sorting protein
MKRSLLFILALSLICFVPAIAAPQSGNGGLDKVLNQMDAAAAKYKTAQASFEWDQYTKVVDEHDIQKGTIYFRRTHKQEVQMKADIATHNSRPEQKYVLYTDSTIQVYQPGIDQITKYDVGKNKSEVESFLVLGFLGRGHDLQNSFDVNYLGTEKIDNIEAAKLELTPHSQAVKNNFNKIILWIDPLRGVSVQQKLLSSSGDFRLAKYSDIILKDNISDDKFKINKRPSTKTVKAR